MAKAIPNPFSSKEHVEPAATLQADTDTGPTMAPAYLVAEVTTSTPVDTLRFNWSFAPEGEGLLRVFAGTDLVGVIDQRFRPAASSEPESLFIGHLPAGTHRIAFRLDGYGPNPSAIELTSIELGQQVFEVTAPTPNQPPVADAGADGVANIGDTVTLDGSASADPDNGPETLTYQWTQDSGATTVLDGADAAKPTFVPQAPGIYVFALKVYDGEDWSDSDTVKITVASLPGDLDGDGDIDRDDLNVILAARNQPASGPDDARDLDGDGKITALDARKLVLLCTRPRCATQ